LPTLANQAEFIRRFEGEAQLVARLEHPHITPLYNYWRDTDGAYLVMRWLRGGSLAARGSFELRAAALLLD
jgi:serine/threonine protein kinase